MIIAVRAEVMPVFLQAADQRGELRIAIEAPGEEEGSRNVFSTEEVTNDFTGIGIFIAGKNERQLLFRGVAPDDGAAAQREAPWRGRAFFGFASASFAASR